MICYSFIPEIEQLFSKYKFSSPPPFVEYTLKKQPLINCFFFFSVIFSRICFAVLNALRPQTLIQTMLWILTTKNLLPRPPEILGLKEIQIYFPLLDTILTILLIKPMEHLVVNVDNYH